MDDSSNKTELDAEQIRRIRLSLADKAHNWILSGGRWREGIEVFQTQDEEIFVVRDVETGVEIGMRKQVTNGGVVTKLSFM